MVAKTREKPQSLMPGFVADLAVFLHAKRGRITALARHLGTHQQHVSAWLANKQEPSGENVLQIMQWLEVERAELADIEAKKSAALKALTARSKSANA
jgi:transcriptional regulator with XRE-family HTH domain